MGYCLRGFELRGMALVQACMAYPQTADSHPKPQLPMILLAQSIGAILKPGALNYEATNRKTLSPKAPKKP